MHHLEIHPPDDVDAEVAIGSLQPGWALGGRDLGHDP